MAPETPENGTRQPGPGNLAGCLQDWLAMQGIRIDGAEASRLLKTLGRLSPSPEPIPEK